jgi:glutamate N-acetyltransferase/amino-acid N-acetyltransferase
MTQRLAGHLNCDSSHVLVCSTGVIGRPMPMDAVDRGVDHAFAALDDSWDGVEAAASGILTTDSVTKIVSRSIEIEGKEVRVLGICKGAAMIGPNMATMLGLIVTDGAAAPEFLDRTLRTAVDRSFHCISVEGHTSTNDTVLLLANGASGVTIPQMNGSDFVDAICEVAEELARKIAEDAEGASHLIQIDVHGTRTDEEARKIAKAVADSPLVKTAVYGADPNWGRICSAAGYAGVDFEEKNLSLRVNGTLLYDCGAPTPFDPAVESKRIRDQRETNIELILDLGRGKCRFWSCDLTVEYVRFNADYTT